MSFNFTVSPSFPAERISDWYIFNTWLQRALALPIHLELYDDFGTQRRALAASQADMIHANPFDASLLVRERGFQAVAQPEGPADEMVVVVAAGSSARCIPDLPPGTRIACIDDPCVNTVGRILLETASLTPENSVECRRATCVQVAKALLRDEADVGFLPVAAFDGLSSLVRRELRVLVRSEIQVLRHLFLVGPALHNRRADITRLLLAMHESPRGQDLLDGLGARRWQAVSEEDVEFMIDIISTLTQ